MAINRRRFLRTAAAATTALASARIAAAAPRGDAGPAPVDLVRLLIDSDREHLLEQLVARIRAGLDYPTLLGAVAEASAREVRPYPHVGYKYHAFMVLHAVHLTTLLGRPDDRWLPVLWSADTFKASQAAERRLSGWTLGPLREQSVPTPGKAEQAFRLAMERWDPEAADAAVVGLVRAHPGDRVFELLFRYAARDLRAIGHKAITVANCHRLMGVVRPDHLEPMLRSLALALQNHEGEPNPAASDLASDRSWRRNLVLSERSLKVDQSRNAPAGDRIVAMLEVLREGSEEEASGAILAGLDQGVPETDLWTAVFCVAGDLMLKQSGIISVHATTTANALHYAYRQVANPTTRRLLLLQAAAFMPLFRELLGEDRRSLRIEGLEASEVSQDPRSGPEEIFEEIGFDRVEAARNTLGYLRAGGPELPFMTSARRYTVDRNRGYHDYKLTEAAFENASAMASPWRERYLATSTLYLNGPADEPNGAVARARELLG